LGYEREAAGNSGKAASHADRVQLRRQEDPGLRHWQEEMSRVDPSLDDQHIVRLFEQGMEHVEERK